MKQKYTVLTLRILGAALICFSIIVTIIQTNNFNIVGGADFSTYCYVFIWGRGRLYNSLTVLGFAAIIASFITTCKNKTLKNITVLSSPLLLFPVLCAPYSEINSKYIVEWFGCGCPKLDEFGNYIENDFNANDFTAIFWLFITVIVTVISVFLSRRIPKNKIWLRLLYIVGMLAVSLLVARKFYYSMMWN